MATKPEPIVGTTAPSGASAIQNLAEIERHRSNQITIIGWVVCVFLFKSALGLPIPVLVGWW